jgi:hypothetical protein
MTPDRLLGRVESVRTTISLLIAPVGPLTAGFLLGAVSERSTIAVFAAFGLECAPAAVASQAIARRYSASLSKLSATPSFIPVPSAASRASLDG